jgi:hypothetical protein
VEQVCDWVTSKSFKAYRAVFRDGLVNGHMLLTITPEILETNGIKNMYVCLTVETLESIFLAKRKCLHSLMDIAGGIVRRSWSQSKS